MAPVLVDWHARYSQQARWTAPLRRYYLERIALQPGDRLLEVGCGTGAVLAQITNEITPLPALHGLDIDEPALRQAGRHVPGIRLVHGDAQHLPYATDSFQAVICHYLLLWLDDPLAALGEMRRVTRPGGWVLSLAEPDYGGRIDYPEALEVLGEQQREALRRQGADPRLGRKLPGLFQAAGLREVEGGVLGSQWQGPPPAEERAQEWAVLAADLAGRVPQEELERLQQVEQQAWQHGRRVLFVPTFYCVSRK
jgi:SAM-dependent methyltransferase